MTNSIPASQLVSVTPGVLGAGGNPLSLNGVILSQDSSIPQGAVLPFATAAAVSAWFGPAAPETALANIYFGGFTGANKLPGSLLFAPYNTAAVGAYLRGATVSGLTLAQIQALSGTLTVTVNGVQETTASINLSAATSFSNAASLISTALQATSAVFSGTGSISGTTLTISAVTSGSLQVGDVILGTGVTAATTITALGTGTGGTGTYTVNNSQTVASETITVGGLATCTYDAQRQAFVISSPTTGATSTIGFASGTLAPGLYLTSATGAVTSQGAAAAVPATLMNAIVAVTQNWATFMTVTEVVDSVKLQFAAWVNSQNSRYLYVVQDSNAAVLAANASSSFGVLTAAYNGVMPIYDNTGGTLAAFVLGTTASIDFTQTAGRITYAFKGSSQITPQITDPTVAANIISNGYNFYGQYATAAQQFQLFQPGLVSDPGLVSGLWQWADAYVNQIYLNSQLQLALMSLLSSTKSIPYNTQGYGLARAACLDPINQAVNFGSIQPGIALSAAQVAQINAAAGVAIAATVQNTGWYLQVLPASAQVRAARGSPPMTLFYADGGAIQKINLASIDVQ